MWCVRGNVRSSELSQLGRCRCRCRCRLSVVLVVPFLLLCSQVAAKDAFYRHLWDEVPLFEVGYGMLRHAVLCHALLRYAMLRYVMPLVPLLCSPTESYITFCILWQKLVRACSSFSYVLVLKCEHVRHAIPHGEQLVSKTCGSFTSLSLNLSTSQPLTLACSFSEGTGRICRHM